MYFRQILNADLGCASYVIADGGAAAVIDPGWAIDEYLAAAGETHAHSPAWRVTGNVDQLTGLNGAIAERECDQ